VGNRGMSRVGQDVPERPMDDFEEMLRKTSLGQALEQLGASDAAEPEEVAAIRRRAGLHAIDTGPSTLPTRSVCDDLDGKAPDRDVLFPSLPTSEEASTDLWALVSRAQLGDAQAFGHIYDRYFDTVFRFIYFRVGNRPLAEDLTADTFLRALKRIGSVTPQTRDIGAWLVTIARDLVADHFKSAPHQLDVNTDDVLDADREDRAREGSVGIAAVDQITNVTLLGAIRQLNPEQQECIVLRFVQGFSVAETAQAMDTNEGAVKALQYRAVRALHRLVWDTDEPQN
jgi:RNA polymerase sigma-70 factor, ECF subfamily